MRPKEYYEQFTIQEDAKYIFTLMSIEFEKQYKKYIKEPIEKIKLDDGKVTCESYPDFEGSTDQVDEVWKSIQKAGIIIANITEFKPNVMFELGVALMKKGRVILIAEKSLEGKPNLPFNISTLGVEYYEPNKFDEFSDRLVTQVEKWITPDEPKIKDPRVIKLMNDVLGLRRDGKYDSALLLFESMDKLEPGNWYIYKEWGTTYKESKDYDKACKKLQKALEFTKSNKHKSEIYTELGVVYRENKMENQALVVFGKAENLDRDNADLFEKWAYLYYKMGRYNDAMNKMMQAVNLDKNNKGYKLRFEFYSKKFLEPNFTMGIKRWLEIKKIGVKPPPPPEDNTGPNRPGDFKWFTKIHKVRDILEGRIVKIIPTIGVFVQFERNITGLIFWKKLPRNFDVNPRFKVGNLIKVKIKFYRFDKYQVELDIAN